MIPWVKREYKSKSDWVDYYSRMFNMTPCIIQLLLDQGLWGERELTAFFYPRLSDLHDPFQMNEMKEAVVRINKAIANQEHILVFGDYDVDGITATTILVKALTMLGANVSFRLPIRREGYGVTSAAVEDAHHIGISLIVTVDNGSSAHAAMKTAIEKGIDIIVTDHHEVLGEHPKCVAFINPKRSDNTYPDNRLAGAGVSFKLVQALFQESGRAWNEFAWEFIEYACLGTMADLMQLQGENRIIAKLGMMKLKQTPSPVFRELTRQLFVRSFNCDTIYYKIAPIFNAIGRIDDPNKAVQLLLDSTSDERTIADLISYNERRKVITADQFFSVDARIQSQNLHENQVIVVQGELHEGIIGILASRITEKYKKPSIVITQEGKGSARSVPNSDFSIIETIKRASGNLKSFGGHQAAAGLSIETEKLSTFRYEIQQSALLEPAIRPNITYDHEINIDQFQDEMYEDLFLLEPFGNGNRKPIYYSKDTIITKWKPFGKENAHMNINTKKKKAILFYHNNEFNVLPDQRIDFLYKPSFNHNKKEFIVAGYR